MCVEYTVDTVDMNGECRRLPSTGENGSFTLRAGVWQTSVQAASLLSGAFPCLRQDLVGTGRDFVLV